jgi:hypothetical protein
MSGPVPDANWAPFVANIKATYEKLMQWMSDMAAAGPPTDAPPDMSSFMTYFKAEIGMFTK